MDFDARPFPGVDMNLDFPSNLALEKNLSYPFLTSQKPPSFTEQPNSQPLIPPFDDEDKQSVNPDTPPQE